MWGEYIQITTCTCCTNGIKYPCDLKMKRERERKERLKRILNTSKGNWSL